MLALASSYDIVVKHSGIGCDDAELERRVPTECSAHAMTFIWDVDAPATIYRMRSDPKDALRHATRNYDAILTYGGGPKAREGFLEFGARAYYSIYNGLDPDTHFPVTPTRDFAGDVAFLGNRLPDREARVEELFLRAAELAPDQRFILGGEGWADKHLPPNVRYIGHVPTADHNHFNCSVGMVMNINRASMADFGFSPPTRVFEVAGAGTCLLCDDWPGISDCFEPGEEILVVRNAEDVARALHEMTPRPGVASARHSKSVDYETIHMHSAPRRQTLPFASAWRAARAKWDRKPTPLPQWQTGSASPGSLQRQWRKPSHENRHLWPDYHFGVGKWPCHHLPIAGQSAGTTRPPRLLHRERC
jgi:hypothetical protein